MNVGFYILSVLLLGLVALALMNPGETFPPALKRWIEQFAKLFPRMLCALVAAGFIAQMIPGEAIARTLGDDAGLLALPVAALTGVLVPGGPVITFALAAVFARSGASVPALVTFITAWSVFAAHRILIYEIPLLGSGFLRIRVASGLVVPFAAGLLAMLVGLALSFGQPSIS